MNKFFKIVIVLFILSIFVSQRELLFKVFRPTTAYAVGDLIINWGVPIGQPLFSIHDSFPGQSITKIVQVTNNAPGLQQLSIRGVKKYETGNINHTLFITINKNGQDIYGGTTGIKSLATFFTATTFPSAVAIGTILPNTTQTFAVTITFDEQAGNAYQGKKSVFDLYIGIKFDLPKACKDTRFHDQPIYGTTGNDHLSGTSGNDLLIGLSGNDTIEGKSGNDCIIGGKGDDTLRGGDGNDTLIGDDGKDKAIGEKGVDTCSAEITQSCEKKKDHDTDDENNHEKDSKNDHKKDDEKEHERD